MHVSVRTDLSVADNAKRAILLHVSTPSEGQDGEKKTRPMKKRTKRQILKPFKSMDLFLCRPKFIKYLDSKHR